KRYLAGEPFEARPPSAGYRLGKFVRRHRVAVGAATAFAVLLLAGGSGASLGMLRAVRAERLAREEAAEGKAGNGFLPLDLLSQAEAARHAAEDRVTLLEVLDRAAEKVGDRFTGKPEVEAALRATLADTYRGLGSFAKAERQALAALEVERRLHGPEAAVTYKALCKLAEIRTHLGQYGEALEPPPQATEGLSRTLGPDHPDTLAGRNNLANAHLAAGHSAEAVALHEQTLRLKESKLGPDHPDTLAGRNNLANAYRAAGRTAEAV